MPDLTDKEEIKWARIASFTALAVAIWFGINPPSAFIAKTVAFAFGLAASSFFPTLLIGIFSKRVGGPAAIAGMAVGITFTFLYIVYFQFLGGTPDQYLFASSDRDGITPEGIGFVGMLLNFAVTLILGYLLPPPPAHVQEMVEDIHVPTGSGAVED